MGLKKGNAPFTAIVTVISTGFKYVYGFNAFGKTEAKAFANWKFDTNHVIVQVLSGNYGMLEDGTPYLLPY